MFRQLIILLLGAMLILTACSTDQPSNDSHSNQTEENGGGQNEPAGNQLSDQDNTDVEQPIDQTSSPSRADVEEIFKLVKKATQSISSMTITGVSESESTFGGDIFTETTEMKLMASFDPFVQHGVVTVISGDRERSEWYATDDDMYFYFEGLGWQKFVHPASLQSASLFYRDEYFDHFITYKDQFQLTEDKDHFIITYVGSEELYQDIFYGLIEDTLGEISEGLNQIIEESNMSGSVEMKISKDSFLIVEQSGIHKSSDNTLGTLMESVQDATYVYTYNEVSRVEIPDEVIQTATELPSFLDIFD